MHHQIFKTKYFPPELNNILSQMYFHLLPQFNQDIFSGLKYVWLSSLDTMANSNCPFPSTQITRAVSFFTICKEIKTKELLH